jgi:hypothetical protein
LVIGRQQGRGCRQATKLNASVVKNIGSQIDAIKEGSLPMKPKVVKCALGVAASVVLVACLGFAGSWGMHKSSAKSTNFIIASAMKLPNGEVIQPGTYKLEVPENSQSAEATIYQDGKLIAKSPVNMVAEQQKNPDTEVESTHQGDVDVINEIRPQGWTTKVVFAQPGGQGSKAGQ